MISTHTTHDIVTKFEADMDDESDKFDRYPTQTIEKAKNERWVCLTELQNIQKEASILGSAYPDDEGKARAYDYIIEEVFGSVSKEEKQ